MEYKIIVDSCCDMTPELAERLGVTSVPMTLMLGSKEFVDDETLDLPDFMVQMKNCKEKVSTAAPSPFSFMEAITSAINSFVVTISSGLSASYANARMGKDFADENGDATNVHIFDTKSASAGEVLVAIKIRELLTKGIPVEQIISSINHFIDNMKTYFVLEKHDNLIKNGRLNKITGAIVQLLNVKLIMGADGKGTITLFSKPLGHEQMLERLIALIRNSKKTTSGENLVICHCNNLPLAKQLSDLIKRQFSFKEILIVPTRGAISLYADDKGIVMAF